MTITSTSLSKFKKYKSSFSESVATLFGQLWRLEPLAPEKKAMWRREMECLLSVSDYIVELKPTWQTFPDGSKLEVQVQLHEQCECAFT